MLKEKKKKKLRKISYLICNNWSPRITILKLTYLGVDVRYEGKIQNCPWKKILKKDLRKTLKKETDGQELCLGDIKSYL